MSLSLSSFPDDILLRVAKFLQLEDVLAFSMVCYHFHSLASERIFWITVLTFARSSRPLALPSHEDLSSYDAGHLKRLAIRAVWIEHNISCTYPDIIGLVKHVHCGAPCKILFNLPGTSLVMTHSPLNGVATCWNTKTENSLCSQHIGRGIAKVLPSSIEEPGRSHVGVQIELDDRTTAVAVICIDYGSNGVSMKVLFRREFVDLVPASFCFDREVVAIPQYNVQHEIIEIIAFQIPLALEDEPIHRVIQTDIPYYYRFQSHRRLGPMALINRNGYFLIDHLDVQCSYFYHCPADRLPYGKLSADSPTTSSLVVPNILLSSFYEVAANTNGDFPFFGHYRGHTRLRFWNLEPHLIPGPPSLAMTIEETFCPGVPRLCTTTWCSSFMGTFSADHDGCVILRTLRYRPLEDESKSTSFHVFRLPPFFKLYNISSCWFDDHWGVLMIADNAGTLHSIPYA